MKNLLIVCLMISSHQLLAQNDKIYLKDNGYMKGKVTAMSQQHLNISLSDHDSIKVPLSAVTGVHLKKKKTRNVDWVALAKKLNNRQNNQWYFEGSVGGIFDDSGNGETLRLSLSSSAIYRWNKWLQLGVGLDYNRYANMEVVPLYARYIGSLTQMPNKGWFYYGAYGWAKSWKRGDCDCNITNTEGKSIKKFGLGYRFAVNELSLGFSLGWLQQQVSYSFINIIYYDFAFSNTSNNEVIVRQKLNGVEIKLSLMFH